MFIIVIFLGFCCLLTVNGQVDSIPSNQVSKELLERLKAPLSTVQQEGNDLLDTIAPVPTTPTAVVNISNNALNQKVNYGAKDSINYDNANNKVHLYGDAFVKYEGLDLKAGYIEISLDSNIAVAQTYIDSAGNLSGQPSFTDGSQDFRADKMRYNFKSQKGIVYDVATTQSNLFLKGRKTKFISQKRIENDSTVIDNVLFNRNAIFSTCDAPHPHYGIRSRKQKVVAEKVVVVGFSNLEIGGIPTPLFLPFG